MVVVGEEDVGEGPLLFLLSLAWVRMEGKQERERATSFSPTKDEDVTPSIESEGEERSGDEFFADEQDAPEERHVRFETEGESVVVVPITAVVTPILEVTGVIVVIVVLGTARSGEGGGGEEGEMPMVNGKFKGE